VSQECYTSISHCGVARVTRVTGVNRVIRVRFAPVHRPQSVCSQHCERVGTWEGERVLQGCYKSARELVPAGEREVSNCKTKTNLSKWTNNSRGGVCGLAGE
jgi:hypothetical protein